MSGLLSLQLTIFLLIALGFIFRKLNLVTESGQKSLTNLVLYLVLPCNIFTAFIGKYTMDMLYRCGLILLISLAIQAFAVLYGKIFFRHKEEGVRKCLEYGIICSNAGLLGNPIAEGVYGTEGLMLASVYLIPQRIMMWSFGLASFSGSRDWKATWLKVIKHPCIIATFAGILLMLTQYTLPDLIMDPIEIIGRCNTALSMMVIGMILSEINPRDLIDRDTVSYTVQRLILIPALIYIVCLLFHCNHLVTGLSVLLASMPAGATTPMLASKYDINPHFATKMVVFSTLCSIPTIIIWSYILR